LKSLARAWLRLWQKTNKKANASNQKNMKTKLIISAALIFAASFMANASAPKRMLTMYDQLGRKLMMPVKAEEEAEVFPFDSKMEFNRYRSSEVNRTFDLSGITKPEAEIKDIPCDLENVFKQITK
jgi:hypothetical protein